MYTRQLTILLLLSLTFRPALATHIVGGEMYYECLGGDDYRVTLKIYRDCGPSNTNNTQFDQNAVVTAYDAAGGLVLNDYFPFPGANQLPVVINNPCLQAPPNICVEEAIYTKIMHLPAIPGGYNLIYQRCCRNPTIINIVDPQDFGATYTTHIPDPNKAVCNTSPYFNNFPPLALCVTEHMTFDHSATDPDGDSLTYEFCTPYHGGSPSNPAPNPANPPQHPTINWQGGYNTNYQIASNPAFSLDPQTGMLQGTPSQLGQYVVGVMVKEYRNGLLLGETRRDFQFNVTNCTVNVVAAVPTQQSYCDGYTVSFQNNSVGAQYYHWDFGVLSLTDDTSDLATPTYTYPDSGSYTVMLIANPYWPCADTAYINYDVYPALDPKFDRPNPQCINGNSFIFAASGLYGDSAVFLWEFGANASPANSTAENPVGIEFNSVGWQVVKLTIWENGCEESYVDSVKIFPMPTADFYVEEEVGCVPFRVWFKDQSFAWTNIHYLWDFGDGTFSNLSSPVHTYQRVGVYDIKLTIWTDEGCIDTVTFMQPGLITVNPRPTAGFTVTPDQQSIFSPEFEFIDYSYSGIKCNWIYGDGNESFTCGDHLYSYSDTGNFTVIQVIENEYGCLDIDQHDIRVNPEYLLYAPNAFTPNGDGVNDFFHPVMMGVRKYEILIFDRWGEEIFRGIGTEHGWDGRAKGGKDVAQIGVYPYLINITDVNGKPHQYFGTVTLVR